MPVRPILDAQATPNLRVRSWRHSGETYRGGEGAHRALEVAWVEKGAAEYRIGSRLFTVSAGEVMIVPPEVEHATSLHDGTIAGSVWLGSEMFAEIADAMPSSAGARLMPGPASRGARIEGLIRLLISEASAADEGVLAASEALGEALAIEALRVAPSERRSRTASDPRIRAAIDRVETEIDRPINVDEMARAAGMSRFHFSRIFREEVGSSPYQFLIEARVRRAASLLRTGRYSVTEAALSSGFNDLGRFARSFRKIIGCSPSEAQAARSDARTARSATRALRATGDRSA